MKRSTHSRPSRGEDRGPRRRDDARGPASRTGGSRDAASRGSRGPASRTGGSGDAAGRGSRGPAGGRDRPRAGGAPGAPARRVSRPADPAVILARQPWVSLRPLVPGEGAEVETRLDALKAYALQLLEWNRGVSNLVSRHDEPRLVERHLRESLLPAREILASGCERFVDFGSGAGLPAVPLALCGVGSAWTLVESRRNKTLFLKKIKQDIGLRDFEVMTGRLEVLVDEVAVSLACDGFTSRATAAIGPTLELAARVVRPGGRAFLWKGSSYENEMASTRDAWQLHWRFEHAIGVPDGPNVIAIFERLEDD